MYAGGWRLRSMRCARMVEGRSRVLRMSEVVEGELCSLEVLKILE